jgi:hypothetical protein
MRFNTFTTIELVGFLISGLFGLIQLFRSATKDRDTARYHRTLGGVLTVLGLILTIALSIRYEYIGDIALFRDEDVLKTVTALKESKEKIKTNDSHIFNEVFNEREQAFSKTIKSVSTGTLTLSPQELSEHAIQLFQNEKNITILATSYVKPTEWWKTTWGQEYLKENFTAVNTRGVSIERIYIFLDEKELNENRQLLQMQKDNKIAVRYVFARDVSNSDIKDDVIVIGDKLCGTLSLKDREMVAAIFSVNRDDIAQNKQKFESLKKTSVPF